MSWRILYWIAGVMTIVILFLRSFLPETPSFEAYAQHRAASKPTNHGNILSTFSEPLQMMLEPKSGRALISLMFFDVPFATSVTPALTLLSKHLQEHLHVRPEQVSMIFVGGSAASLLATPLLGRLCDQHGKLSRHKSEASHMVINPMQCMHLIQVEKRLFYHPWGLSSWL